MAIKNCGGCGTNNEINAVYCLNCGTALSEQTSIVDKQAIKTALPQERNYMIWGIILAIVSISPGQLFSLYLLYFDGDFIGVGSLGSIFAIVSIIISLPYAYYIYLNFKDFKIMQEITQRRTQYTPLLFAILYLLFPIITYYVKYNMLTKHKSDYNEDLPPPNPFVVISILHIIPFLLNNIYGSIFSQFPSTDLEILFLFSNIVYYIVIIFALFFESKWQKAFNWSIQSIKGNTIQ